MALLDSFLPLLERTLNSALADNLRARELNEKLSGKICAIELRDWQITFYLLPANDQLQLAEQLAPDQQVDVTISGTIPIMARTALGQHPQGLIINGDAALAQSFQQLLRQAEFDWEGNLAQVIGDLPAHQLGRLARGFLQWGQQAGEAMQATVQQYLAEENSPLPHHDDVAQFAQQVDVLRDDLARFEARLQKIQSGI